MTTTPGISVSSKRKLAHISFLSVFFQKFLSVCSIWERSLRALRDFRRLVACQAHPPSALRAATSPKGRRKRISWIQQLLTRAAISSLRESWRKRLRGAGRQCLAFCFLRARPQPHHAERRKGSQHGGTDQDGQQAACDPLRPHIPGGGRGWRWRSWPAARQPGHSGRHPDAGRFLHVPPT